MTTKDMHEEFKQILEYGYHRGNSNCSITTKDLVQELSEQLRTLMEKHSNPITRVK